MKFYTIAPVPRLSFVGLGATYLVAFWCALAIRGAVGNVRSHTGLGPKTSAIATYAALLLIPAALLTVALQWLRWHKIHNLPFIKLRIRSAADGATYSLRVAENMQVNDFLRQYVGILRRGPARNQVEATVQRHYPVCRSGGTASSVTSTAI